MTEKELFLMKYGITEEQLFQAISYIVYNQYFGDMECTWKRVNEFVKRTEKFIYHHDFIDFLFEDYKKDLIMYFEEDLV